MDHGTTSRPPALVVAVSLLDPSGDYDTHVNFLGHEVRLVRIGTGGRVDEAFAQATKWAAQAQVIAMSGLRDAPADGVPVTHGDRLRTLLQEWAVRQVQAQLPGYFDNARVLVLDGAAHHSSTTRVLREYTDNISHADPRLLDLFDRLESVPVVGRAAHVALQPAHRLPHQLQTLLPTPGPIADALTRRAARDCDVVVATYDELMDADLTDLRGKAVITEEISGDRLAELAALDVDLVLDCTPQPFDVVVDPAVLEALMLVTSPGSELSDDELLDKIVAAGLEPRMLQPNGPRRKSRFAFVIHPLSQRYFDNVEPLRTISKFAPGVVMDAVEKVMAYTPPFTYSHITGIHSPTGAEVEGWLITIGGTPDQLLAHSPQFTYAKLLAAAEIAKKLGAQIMGLGAFTKVVGDAGVTVAKQAPLPITTGNSYSASAALWAAHDALQRLGLVEVDPDGRIRGKAMVVGATGAIGSVCARLLALASDEVFLVSPESAKLLALKEDIERENPRAQVRIAATPRRHLAKMDLIVTATSGAGKKVLDIAAVKPGCVITDVARPLDLSADDAARRPDVLIVESGEIELPGEVHMRNIGLPRGVAYACLAETIVLALEGRYETFTVGRDIDWESVKEIYRLGLKHGMKLATISGANGVFTDADIEKVHDLALAELAERTG